MRVKEFCARVVTESPVEAPDAPGVYVILNKITMRAYIGQSTSIASRFRSHKSALKSGTHGNPTLQADWKSYGAEAFAFHVFSSVEPADLLDVEYDLITESLGDDCYNFPWSDRGQGRKPLPPDQATKPRSVRLNDERWAKLKLLGTQWLEARIDKAKLPTGVRERD